MVEQAEDLHLGADVVDGAALEARLLVHVLHGEHPLGVPVLHQADLRAQEPSHR
jgi:hypothetical protein